MIENSHFLGWYETDAPLHNLFIMDDFGNLVSFNVMISYRYYIKQEH